VHRVAGLLGPLVPLLGLLGDGRAFLEAVKRGAVGVGVGEALVDLLVRDDE